MLCMNVWSSVYFVVCVGVYEQKVQSCSLTCGYRQGRKIFCILVFACVCVINVIYKWNINTKVFII